MTATFQDKIGGFVVENIISITYFRGSYIVEFEGGEEKEYTDTKLLSICAY